MTSKKETSAPAVVKKENPVPAVNKELTVTQPDPFVSPSGTTGLIQLEIHT